MKSLTWTLLIFVTSRISVILTTFVQRSLRIREFRVKQISIVSEHSDHHGTHRSLLRWSPQPFRNLKINVEYSSEIHRSNEDIERITRAISATNRDNYFTKSFSVAAVSFTLSLLKQSDRKIKWSDSRISFSDRVETPLGLLQFQISGSYGWTRRKQKQYSVLFP